MPDNKEQSPMVDMSKIEEPKVDWDRLRATTEEEIEAQATEDEGELFEWTPEMIARARAKNKPKELISIRMDPDLMEKLRADGPGY